MTKSVNIHEAKTHFSKLVQRAHQGEEIIVSKSGKPLAKLAPLDAQQLRIPGQVEGYVDEAFFEPLSDSQLNVWE